MRNKELRIELLRMAEQDQATRKALALDGSLFEGYHPQMEEVHRKNAGRLESIIQKHGWPGMSLVGEDGEEAAWIIAQHAIGLPDFQRSALKLLIEAAKAGEAPYWQSAYLEDRIRMFEGRLQLYGTQLDWDENGELSPYPAIEDAEHVNERRLNVRLSPIEESIRQARIEAATLGEKAPVDLESRRKQMNLWAESKGWRKQIR